MYLKLSIFNEGDECQMIATSADISLRDSAKRLGSGFTDHITKPMKR